MYLAFAVGGAVAPGGFLDGVHLHLVAPKRGLRLSELGHRTEAKHISYQGVSNVCDVRTEGEVSQIQTTLMQVA